jgi:hypothetical protein
MGANTNARWKDRGKVPELEPPPYEQGGWVPNRVGICPYPWRPVI